MLHAILAISTGAALGALLRWGLSAALNGIFPAIPPGTWLANLLGGWLMGLALGFFGQHDGLDPAWRLFVITGFLGSLTTFSTFSAEVVALIQHDRLAMAGVAISAHVIGSLMMTLLGLGTWKW
ncbi:MAG: fluoride efflux transporter CrcB, partial [Lautropia sp.]|nr:fluoride efflux transporter CrcB [Lautropia sp.]